MHLPVRDDVDALVALLAGILFRPGFGEQGAGDVLGGDGFVLVVITSLTRVA